MHHASGHQASGLIYVNTRGPHEANVEIEVARLGSCMHSSALVPLANIFNVTL